VCQDPAKRKFLNSGELLEGTCTLVPGKNYVAEESKGCQNCQNPAIARIARIAVIARIEKQDAGIEASVFLGCKKPRSEVPAFQFWQLRRFWQFWQLLDSG